jgi:hypothetical protein
MAESADQPKVGVNRGNAGKGRPKGVRNKATADVKALAGQYSEVAIKELARLATSAESEAARVSAIKELLDRAHGRPTQAVEHSGVDGKAIKHVLELTDEALAVIASR